jgi:hypothetical protein
VQRDVDVKEEIAAGMEAGACFGFVSLNLNWCRYFASVSLSILFLVT